MTVFKGLMSSETTVGMGNAADVETGGGFCTFSTTFAIPDGVQADALQKLKTKNHSTPTGRLVSLFNYEPSDPDPQLGIIPITQSTVSIEVFEGAKASPDSAPMVISAQGGGKGSVEIHGRNSFLVTCNELAAGAIAGSLRGGTSPFTVHNELSETFYVNDVTVNVTVDVDKVYDSFSFAASASGFLGLTSASASAAYASCVTSGGITTEITENGAAIDQATKDWISKNAETCARRRWTS